MRRSGRVNIIGILLLLVLVAGGGWAWLFGPYYWDYQVMKELTKATAHEWSGLGEMKARQKLPHMLARRGLDEYITERECNFEERGPIKIIDCRWVVDVYYPFTRYYKTLDFSLTTQVAADGDVSQF